MEYQYTIKDIQERVNVSQQSLYSLIKKNKEFINENSTRKQRKVYYNQAVMDFFISYYQPEQPTEEGKNPPSSFDVPRAEAEAKNPPLEGSSTDKPHESQFDATKAEIDALKAEIDALKKQLEMKEAERLELLRQNGALILTLQQTQQEKMLLLPSPKKSFSDKVKSIFKGKPQEK